MAVPLLLTLVMALPWVIHIGCVSVAIVRDARPRPSSRQRYRRHTRARRPSSTTREISLGSLADGSMPESCSMTSHWLAGQVLATYIMHPHVQSDIIQFRQPDQNQCGSMAVRSTRLSGKCRQYQQDEAISDLAVYLWVQSRGFVANEGIRRHYDKARRICDGLEETPGTDLVMMRCEALARTIVDQAEPVLMTIAKSLIGIENQPLLASDIEHWHARLGQALAPLSEADKDARMSLAA